MSTDARVYTTGQSGNDTIPANATSVTITGWGGGGGGSRGALSTYTCTGGGGGGKFVITRAILSSEWGTNLAYQVCTQSLGATANGSGTNPAGGTTQVTGTLNGGAINCIANRGAPGNNTASVGAGGTASGGDTNTNGGNGTAGNGASDCGEGGVSGGGARTGGGGGIRGAGGGAGYNNGSPGTTVGGDGSVGRLEITYTINDETNLGTPNSIAAAPSVGTPALTQDHALTPTGVTAATNTVGAPALTQDHQLTPTGLSAAPSVGNPALTQDSNLGEPPALTAQPSVGAPALTQDHVMTPLGISAGPTVDTPALTQNHALPDPTGISAAPSVGTPDLEQTTDLGTPVGISTGVQLPAVALLQTHVLVPVGISAQPHIPVVTGFDEDEPRDLVSETNQTLGKSPMVHLFVLDLNPIGVDEVYYLTSSIFEDGTQVVFDGQVYTYAPIAMANVEWSANGDPPNPKVSFPNAKKWAANLTRAHKDLIGAGLRRIRVYKHFLDGEVLADPEAVYSDDSFRIEQKTMMNRVMAEFSMRPMRSIENKQIPGMVCMKNTCVLRYRQWDTENLTWIYDTSVMACPFAGGAMFTLANETTIDPEQDVCSHTMDGCIARYPNEPLPASFKPGMARLRI